MKKNSLMKYGKTIIRILDVKGEKALVIDCIRRTMPIWINQSEIVDYADCCQQELLDRTDIALFDIEESDAKSRQITHERYTMIASILPIISDVTSRNRAIRQASAQYDVSQQTIRNYLCLYLVYRDR